MVLLNGKLILLNNVLNITSGLTGKMVLLNGKLILLNNVLNITSGLTGCAEKTPALLLARGYPALNNEVLII
jgi:hypothetical protein